MKRFVVWLHPGLVTLLALVTVTSLLGGCTTRARIPVTGIEVPVPDIPLPAVLRAENDLRSRSWTKAFEILHARLAREYAYTDHKGIDWQAIHAAAAAEVAAAEANKDPDAWYLALRRYVHAIPDGNMQFDPNDVLRDQAVGSSIGIALARLGDGTVIVCGLTPDGPGAAAGIQWGAAITEWNGKPIGEALEGADLLWADAPAATTEGRALQQLAWLPRGRSGDTVELGYVNPGGTPAKATLTMEMDDYATLPLARPLWKPVELFSSPIETRALAGGVHYIRVAAMAPTFSTPFPNRDFRAAVKSAVDQGVKGIILDLRGTQGGDATLPPKLLSSFVKQNEFYETPAVWDAELETFLVESEHTVEIEPVAPAFEGPVVVLVDAYTMGPAESMAAFLQARDGVRVVGESTYGSPGTPTVEIILPGGYTVYFPDRRAVDRKGDIRGVANAKGKGAIAPVEAMALDRDQASAYFQKGTDLALAKALALAGS